MAHGRNFHIQYGPALLKIQRGDMSTGAITKVVGTVTLLTVIAVVLTDRALDRAFISRIFDREANEPASHVMKLPAKGKPLSQPGRTKKNTNSEAAVSVSMSLGEWRLLAASPDAGQEIRPGLTGAQLINLFGAPTLRTTETHNQTVIERYIYVDRDRSTATIAVLENGRTVRSESER
jgi:hypothetical protein